MIKYEKLSTTEIDRLLMMAFRPKRNDRVSLSEGDAFDVNIMARIREVKLEKEFGENIVFFLFPHSEKAKFNISEVAYRVFSADIMLFKMAALKTYHDFSEIIDL